MKKPLTCRERYVIQDIGENKLWARNGGHRERNASECRRLLHSRKRSLVVEGKDVGKYACAKEAFHKLKNAFASGVFSEIATAHYEFSNALKFQGYLQMAVVAAEDKLSCLSDAEVRRLLFVEVL
jgi:hypothetical protein